MSQKAPDAAYRTPAKITAAFPEDDMAPDAHVMVGYGGKHEDLRLLLCAIASRLVEEHITTWEEVATIAVRGARAGRPLSWK